MSEEKDKIALLLKQVAKARENLHDNGIKRIAERDTLVLVVDYIEFMLMLFED